MRKPGAEFRAVTDEDLDTSTSRERYVAPRLSKDTDSAPADTGRQHYPFTSKILPMC